MTVFRGDSTSWHNKYLDLNLASNKVFKNFVLKQVRREDKIEGKSCLALYIS